MRWWFVGWVVAITAVMVGLKLKPGIPEDLAFLSLHTDCCKVEVSDSSVSQIEYQKLPKAGVKEVHAASSVLMRDGSLLTVWYGGSREGAADVQIYSSRFNPSDKQDSKDWSEPKILLSPQQAMHDLGHRIRKLGNPVISLRPDGTLDLYVVSVSLGGWAGSQVNWMSSTNNGHSWSSLKPLWTSPISNISTLVKAPPVYFENGWIGLPVYHEFVGKFAEFLIMDSNHRIVDKIRLSHRREALQPWLAILNDQQAIAYMRFSGNSKREILQTLTTQAGVKWGSAIKAGLPNPNSAVTALYWKNHGMLIVFNRSTDSRRGLSLAFLPEIDPAMVNDLKNPVDKWQVIYSFEENLNKKNIDEIKKKIPKLSYPYMVQGNKGFHIFYSYERDFIRHVQISESWLLKQIERKPKGNTL